MAQLNYAETRRLMGLREMTNRTAEEEAEMAVLAQKDALPVATGPLSDVEMARLIELRAMNTRDADQEAEMQALDARSGIGVPQPVPELRPAPVPLVSLLPVADGSAPIEPPRFRSLAWVYAVRIDAVSPPGPHGGARLTLADNFAPWEAPSAMVRNLLPVPGDFLVIMPDGTNIIMPAARFAAEYEAL